MDEVRERAFEAAIASLLGDMVVMLLSRSRGRSALIGIVLGMYV
jgi:hypothetical protein